MLAEIHKQQRESSEYKQLLQETHKRYPGRQVARTVGWNHGYIRSFNASFVIPGVLRRC